MNTCDTCDNESDDLTETALEAPTWESPGYYVLQCPDCIAEDEAAEESYYEGLRDARAAGRL